MFFQVGILNIREMGTQWIEFSNTRFGYFYAITLLLQFITTLS